MVKVFPLCVFWSVGFQLEMQFDIKIIEVFDYLAKVNLCDIISVNKTIFLLV